MASTGRPGRCWAGLQLAPENRGFSVEFAAIDDSEPSRHRYAYRLQGVDPDWIDSDAELRVASYGNLSPGPYRLRVRATNRSGVWSPHELAERARASVAETPFMLDDGTPLHKTCSIGFACFPPDPAHPEALAWSNVINLADTALIGRADRWRNGGPVVCGTWPDPHQAPSAPGGGRHCVSN